MAHTDKHARVRAKQGVCKIKTASYFNCKTRFVIYALVCPCPKVYVGQTTQELRRRMQQHFSNITTAKKDKEKGNTLTLSCLIFHFDFYKEYIKLDEINGTVVAEFILLGFQNRQNLQISLFCFLLVIFCGTIYGNPLIITLVSTTKKLNSPMYFFISQLSISDILVITNIVPILLQILLNNGGSISFIHCITQLYFLCALEGFECFLLAMMSYDRYVAICNPLRYSTIMTIAHCVKLSITCWTSGFSIGFIFIIKISKINFCGPNIIDHLFCDTLPLLELSCSDTFIVHLEIYVMGIPILMIPTIIIVLSYSFIVSAVLKIKSSGSRQKAFSTCSSHLIVVSTFYWTMFSVYVFPTKGRTLTMSKILSLLYTVFTPFINPIVYSLRNQDIRKAILKHAAW
ncbi:olfactory receptor 11L1-like [Dendrobates tinctorius]|uniref:olfactory receptor 11L1-like n=1 Tax=Dendrobates tinctorius TaxID=92724 RepID=UPI003CC9C872